jgi:hypothetical protein
MLWPRDRPLVGADLGDSARYSGSAKAKTAAPRSCP